MRSYSFPIDERLSWGYHMGPFESTSFSKRAKDKRVWKKPRKREDPMVTGDQKWGSRGAEYCQIHRKCHRVLLGRAWAQGRPREYVVLQPVGDHRVADRNHACTRIFERNNSQKNECLLLRSYSEHKYSFCPINRKGLYPRFYHNEKNVRIS